VCFSALRPLDGAMGTELLARGAVLEEPLTRWCGTRPEVVRAVHRAYAAAGAQALTTNTLLAWREPDSIALTRRAVSLARETAPALPVFVSAGPGGKPDDYAALSGTGGDLILLETFTRISEAEAAVRSAVQGRDVPVVALLVIDTDGRTLGDSISASEAGPRLVKAGATAVGVNCQPPDILFAAIKSFAADLPADVPLILRPSAGIPGRHDKTEGDMCSWVPEVWADAVARLATEAGRNGFRPVLVGGCCGAGPAHIAALAPFLKSLTPLPQEKQRCD
jgi:methionine synthase I (cobalamin-dependent)